MTKQRVANAMLQDIPWDGTELAAPLTLPGALLATSYYQQAEIVKPTNPPAGSLKLYAKSDHKFYQLDSAGNEMIISGMSQAQADARYLQLTGGTLTGPLTVQGGVTSQGIVSSGSVTAVGDVVTGGNYRWGQITDPEVLYKEMPGRLRLTGAQLTVDSNLNVGSYTQLAEITTPVTPNTGQMRLYAKADHNLYIKDITGTEASLLTFTQADNRYPQKTDVDPYPQYLTPVEGDVRYSSNPGAPSGGYVTYLAGDARYLLQTGGTLTGNLLFSTDNTKDIGASGATRPRTVYAATSVVSQFVTGPGNFDIGAYGIRSWEIDSTRAFYPVTDNSFDLGEPPSWRIRTMYLGTSLVLSAGGKIQGDFSTATLANRTLLQSSVADGVTEVTVVPNGTATASYIELYNRAVPTNSAGAYLGISNTIATLGVGVYGTGTSLPLNFTVGGVERMRISLEGRTAISGLTDVALTGNAWVNPTSNVWTRYDNVNPLGHLVIGQGILTYYTAIAGTGTPAWTPQLNIDAVGTVNLYNSLIVTGNIRTTGGSILMYSGGAFYVTVSGVDHLLQTFGGEQLNWAATGGGFRWVNQNNSVQWMALDTAGNLGVAGGLTVSGNLNAYTGIWGNNYYLGGTGSYYINVSSNICQIVNMNLLSWGWVGLASNPGIYINWDSIGISHTHQIRGPSLFVSGRIISNNWDIGQPNSLGGELYVNGGITLYSAGALYMESGRNVYMVWRGDLRSVYVPYDLGLYTTRICLSRVDWEGSRAVYFNWDGSNVTMNMAGPWGFGAPYLFATTVNTMNVNASYGAAGGYICWQDTNVRIIRTGNQIIWWCWDAVWDFRNTNTGNQAGYIDGSGFHSTSKRKYKTAITPIRDGLKMVMDDRVTPVTYAVKGNATQPDKPSLGFIAEDMVHVVPNAVGRDEEGPSSINYGSLVAVLWDAVRTLNKRIEVLEKTS